VGSRRGSGYDHYLDGPDVTSPRAKAKHGAGIRVSADHEPFDVRDPDNRRAGVWLVGQINDATILMGSVNGSSFGPDIDADRVRLVRYP